MGGHATHSSGGGGAGGRVAVYFNRNETMSAFRFQAIGGKGGSSAENGGAGTVFVYNMLTTMSSYFSIALNEFTVHPNTATTATSSSIGSS
jgi:hypothetical protein